MLNTYLNILLSIPLRFEHTLPTPTEVPRPNGANGKNGYRASIPIVHIMLKKPHACPHVLSPSVLLRGTEQLEQERSWLCQVSVFLHPRRFWKQ